MFSIASLTKLNTTLYNISANFTFVRGSKIIVFAKFKPNFCVFLADDDV